MANWVTVEGESTAVVMELIGRIDVDDVAVVGRRSARVGSLAM